MAIPFITNISWMPLPAVQSAQPWAWIIMWLRHRPRWWSCHYSLITTSNKSLCPFHPTKFPSSIAAASTRHGQEDWAPRHRRPRLGVQVNHKLVPAVGVAKSIQLPVNFILKAKQEVYSYFLLADGVMEITTIEQVLHGNCFLDSIKLVTKLSLHMSLTQQKFFFYSFNTTSQ